MEQRMYTVIESARSNKEDFRTLVNLYSATVQRWCRALTDNQEDIQDIMQEAFLKLYQDLPKLQEPEKFQGWFKKLVVNTAYDWFRKHRKTIEVVDLEQVADLPDLAEQESSLLADDGQLGDSIKAAIERLSANNKIVFTLFYEQDHTCAEIAALLNLSENTVKNRLHRAREQVRSDLAHQPEFQGLLNIRSFRVLLLCGSHKRGGVSLEVANTVKEAVLKLSPGSQATILQLADFQLTACQVCYRCEALRKCRLEDDFNTVYEECLAADVIVVVSPYYAPIPSKISALLERMMAISMAPLVLGNHPGRAFPLQKKWCAVLNFSIVRQQGYMASIIREPLTAMGMGCLLTEDKLPCDASIYDHGKLLGKLIVEQLLRKPDSNAIDNWFDYWNEENLKILDLVRQHELQKLH